MLKAKKVNPRWIRDTIVFNVLQSGPEDLELLLISIALPKCKNLCLGVFYRPPVSSVALFDSLLDVICVVNPFQFSQFVLVGDFNVNMMARPLTAIVLFHIVAILIYRK